MRQDGPFIEAGENDNLIVQRLQADDARARHLRLLLPLREQRHAEGRRDRRRRARRGHHRRRASYAVARPLYIYVKNAHRGVIPGLDEFVAEYVSDDAFGPDGYLPERGLIALDDAERDAIRAAVEAARPMEPVTN